MIATSAACTSGPKQSTTPTPAPSPSTATPTASPQPTEAPPSALTWVTLRNTTYPSELPRSKRALLQDGLYEEEIAPGSATKLRIQLADIAGFGAIDGDRFPDAAVVLIGSPGGSGTFIYLAAVLNDNGVPNPVAATLLGDRVAVRSVKIEGQKIVVGMRVRGPSDPFALLTREVTRVYSLQGGQLVLESEQMADVPSTPPDRFTYEPQRIAITAGSNILRQGMLRPGELATYIVSGAAGEELRVMVKSQFSNAILSIQGVSDTSQLVSRSSYASSWSGVLPATQDYAITVVTLAGNDLQYEMSIELRPGPVPVRTATPAAAKGDASGTATSFPTAASGVFHPAEAGLASLSTDAVQFLEGREESVSVAVISPGVSTAYTWNGDTQLELASSVKVLITLAVLDAAQRENRYVDSFELALLWPMITISDNDSATKLWDQIGGGKGLTNYLASIAASGIRPYDGPYWGTSTASALGLAAVLTRAVFGDILNAEHRALLISLMENVISNQWWGVTAGTEGTSDVVGVKNGWYPDAAGWRVNSLGFVVSSGAQNYYTIAVLTNRQASLRHGIDTIEGVARRVRSSLP